MPPQSPVHSAAQASKFTADVVRTLAALKPVSHCTLNALPSVDPVHTVLSSDGQDTPVAAGASDNSLAVKVISSGDQATLLVVRGLNMLARGDRPVRLELCAVGCEALAETAEFVVRGLNIVARPEGADGRPVDRVLVPVGCVAFNDTTDVVKLATGSARKTTYAAGASKATKPSRACSQR